MRRHRILASAVGLILGALGVAGVHTPGAMGAYLAKITNNANTAATAPYFTCGAALTGESNTKASLYYKLNETKGTTAADSSGNNYPATYTSSGVTYAVANSSPAVCPRDNTTLVSFNGSSGYVVGNTGFSMPTTFSEELWFRTKTVGGKLVGFGDAKPGAGKSTTYDRHIYLNSNGMIVFGIYYDPGANDPGAPYTITSPVPATTTKNYADNTWHHVVATFSAATAMRLYIDGALVGTNPQTNIETYTGYLHIGYDNLDGWPNAPTNPYFTGTITQVGIYTYVLTATQVTSHYRAGTS